jgi:hypothetical protein
MVLSNHDKDQFLTRGYVVLEDCFSQEVAKSWCDRAQERLNRECQEVRVPKVDRVYLQTTTRVPIPDLSPKVWEAICELLGGERRIQPSFVWDSFIVNFPAADPSQWIPPSAKTGGWHIDGDSFRHFLDSQENALVALFCWTTTAVRGGGTFVTCDSIPAIARYLARHTQGVLPREFPYDSLVNECKEFDEITAHAGSVLLLHPFTLHTASVNASDTPRIITNSNIQLRETKALNPTSLADCAPMEKAILRGLGVDRYDFHPTAPRERFTSLRVLEMQRPSSGEQNLTKPEHLL